jgi:hypothetical protein
LFFAFSRTLLLYQILQLIARDSKNFPHFIYRVSKSLCIIKNYKSFILFHKKP